MVGSHVIRLLLIDTQDLIKYFHAPTVDVASKSVAMFFQIFSVSLYCVCTQNTLSIYSQTFSDIMQIDVVFVKNSVNLHDIRIYNFPPFRLGKVEICLQIFIAANRFKTLIFLITQPLFMPNPIIPCNHLAAFLLGILKSYLKYFS